MKILYGVQGTGNGHLSRARAMARHFSNQGADVNYLFSGRPRDQFFDMAPFGSFEVRQGLTFSAMNGQVSYLKTLFKNNLSTFIHDVRSLDLEPYDLILTDFEPLSAWAGKLRNKPVLSIGHQPAFNYPIPVEGAGPLARLVMKFFAPADFHIGLHWHHFNHPILPPIIHIQPDGRHAVQPNKILVYLAFEPAYLLPPLLSRFSDYQFYIYHPSYTEADTRWDVGNIHKRMISVEEFQKDFHSSAAVICGAGFELTSECIHFGKKVLVKPLKNQMEQASNAHALELLGLGDRMDQLDINRIESWLASNKKIQPANYPDVAETVVKWMLEGSWGEKSGAISTLKRLCSQLWCKD